MDDLDIPIDLLAMASFILLMLLNTHRDLSVCSILDNADENVEDMIVAQLCADNSVVDMNAVSRTVLHHFRLCNSLSFGDEDLGFWVKPRSTTWFSNFIFQEYDDNRWVQMFRMTKRSVLSLAQLLSPTIKKKDTKYRLAIPVTVRLACTLFKLSHSASLLICSEMFAVGRSTVSIVLRQVVHAMNVLLRPEISWPTGECLLSVATEFQQLCGLPSVVGAIDGTHFAISKPRFAPVDYYYFKSGGYSITCQAVVDASKRFIDLYMGMHGSTNDSCMLRRSALFHRAHQHTLWDGRLSFQGFSPYLLGDSSYPLLPWLMVLHCHQRDVSIANELFNRKLSRGHGVVENAFGLLKLTFRELDVKSKLHVTFLPDVVICCALLHNLLLKQSHEEMEQLLQVLRDEERLRNSRPLLTFPDDPVDAADVADVEEAQQKRQELGVYLTLQRIVHV